MKNKRLTIAILIVAIMAAGSYYAYHLYNKPVQSLEKKKADLKLTAQKLVEDYVGNEQAADSLYLGKVIEVQGTVSGILASSEDTKIHLDSGNPMAMVICTIEKGKEIGNAKTGDQVTIKGLCSGFLGDVHIEQANVVTE